MKSDRELLEEINRKLDKVCAYIDKVESPEYIQQEYNMQFLLNVGADVWVEVIGILKDLNNGKPNNNTTTM